MGGLVAIGGLLGGIVTVAAGVVILVWPKVIAYIIGIYLIIVGIVAVVASLS